MVPPVAGLVYAADEPRRASFYPLADFSPEWVALRWALGAGPAGAVLRPARRPRPAPCDDAASTRPGRRAIRSARWPQAAGYDDPERWWEDAIEHRHHGAESSPL